jgi:hypothetical protein
MMQIQQDDLADVANPKNHVETISGDRRLLSRKFFFWFNVNQNLFRLRHFSKMAFSTL